VSPSSDVQGLINVNSPGTRFCFAPGLYRLTRPIQPKSGDALLGNGATLNGAKILTSFVRSAGYWVANGQTQESPPHGNCSPKTYTGCQYNEAVYVDNQPLWRVTSLPVGSGQFYFDYANDQIYLGDDPTGHVVEASVVPYAIYGSSAAAVTVDSFVIEKFATSAQSGAIQSDTGPNWVIENNEIRLNHGGGIRSNSPGVIVRGNYIHDNGQIGLTLNFVSNALVTGNEIAHNNTAGFSFGWEAGGTKFWSTSNLTVSDNYVHDNIGPGLWTDTDNIFTIYDGNRVVGNADAGIFHEISYQAVIRNNYVARNGFARGDWLWGGGIQLSTSRDGDVYGNTLVDNANGISLLEQSRGTGLYGTYQVSGDQVHDNTVTMNTGRSGLVRDNGDDTVWTSQGNGFTNNHYCLGTNASYFAWGGDFVTTAQWRAVGQDAGGSFTC
jgi:hypothetical protein